MSGTGGFQTQVYQQPAQAVAGDFASSNPWATYDAGPGGLVSGNPLTVGKFAWTYAPLDPNSAPTVAKSSGAGPVAGFCGRQMLPASITAFLSYASMTISQGQPATLFTQGDFWVVNDGSTAAQIGQKAYARVSDGAIAFAATGSPPASASGFTGSIAASTFSVTGSIAGNVMTVTAVGSGTVVPGATISGTSVASGTKVLSQISGTAGGVGSYYVDVPEQTVASTTISGTYGTMTISGAGTGALGVGQVLSGTNVVSGTKITALGTGTGGTGTYVVDNNTVVGSTADIAGTSWVETKWRAASAGLAGELVKMTSWPTG